MMEPQSQAPQSLQPLPDSSGDGGSTSHNNNNNNNNNNSIRWVMIGNFVHCYGCDNNVVATAMTMLSNSKSNSSSLILNLGHGVQILLHHVMLVNEQGIITHLEPLTLPLPQENENDKKDDLEYWKERLSLDKDSVADDCQVLIFNERTLFLCLGMIDLHCHAPQFAYAGTGTDRPLTGANGWLETYAILAEKSLRDDPATAAALFSYVVQTTL